MAIHKLVVFSKRAKYLLITHSFPHSPQLFPQELSTGNADCGYSFLVHIIIPGRIRRKSYFFDHCGFYHGQNFVQKIGLDREKASPLRGGARKGGGVSAGEMHLSDAAVPRQIPLRGTFFTAISDLYKFFEKRG